MQALITLHMLMHVEDEEEAASQAMKMGEAAKRGAEASARLVYSSDPDIIASGLPFEDLMEEADSLVRILPTTVTILPEGVKA